MAVADRSYASLTLLDRCRNLREPITFVTRLRLDAALYDPAPPRKPGQRGRPRLKGEHLPNHSVVTEDPSTDRVKGSLRSRLKLPPELLRRSSLLHE